MTRKDPCAARRRRVPAITAAILALPLLVGEASAAEEVNVYSYRQPDLVAPLLEAFTRQTGIATNIVFLDKGLVERISAEGANSPADVILTVDIGRLDQAKTAGITQPVRSDAIAENIPAAFRDPEDHWFAVTTRARVVYASVDRVTQNTITYEELAEPKWRGRICTRSGQHVYSIGLFAAMVAHHGADAAQEWLDGLRSNLARKPAGNDRAQAKAIYAGECDIALGNHYYIGLMLTNEKEPEQKEWAASIRVLFPNAEGRGTHANVSGMAMAAHSPHPENALKLMEFLSTGEAQEIYAAEVFEYPVKPGFAPHPLIAELGALRPDDLSLETIARNRKTASELVDKVGFDDGPSS